MMHSPLPPKEGSSASHSRDDRSSRESGQAQTSTERIEARLDAIEAGMTQYTKESKERFDKHEERFDKIEERLDGIDERLDGIDRRFDFVDDRLNDMDQNIKSLTNDLTSFKSAVNIRFDHMDLDISRLAARMHNRSISNPRLLLEPIVVFDLRLGKITPDPRLYPKTAREFFALEKGKTLRDRQRLSYLIQLYQVPLESLTYVEPEDDSFPSLEGDSKGSSEDDEGEEALSATPPINLDTISPLLRERVVEHLAHILGLDRERIEQFEARAAARRNESPADATKRGLETPEGGRRKRKNSGRGRSDGAASSSGKETRLSLRSSEKQSSPIIIPRSDEAARPSDWGSTTNENTTRSRSGAEQSELSYEGMKKG